MQPDYQVAVKEVLESEGIFSNDKYDAGGKTKYGITEHVAIANGKKVENLTIPEAIEIYKKQYWDLIHGDEIKCQGIALLLFDLAVNSGVGSAIMILQDSLNIQNKIGSEWPNMKVDGVLGPVTLHTLNEIVPSRKQNRELFMTIFFDRGEKYLTICRNKETQEVFIDGWQNRLWKYIKYAPQD
jgi:lysozyme family protein